jgi:glycosyltransferase involved in cell wall biosynthesis
MRRYGDLVVDGLSASARSGEIEVERLDVGLAPGVSRRILPRLEPWVRRGWSLVRGTVSTPRRADVVHVLDASTGLGIGLRLDVPVVATVHDVIPVLQMNGRLAGPRPSALARRTIRRTVRDLGRARRIVADSEATARDLVELGEVDATRVRTIGPPVPPAFLGLGPRVGGLRELLVLHVGSDAFYKNRIGVLRVLGRVRQRLPARLALVGPALSGDTARCADALGLRDHIEVHAAPTDADLAALYERAAVLLMPSLYEGFGWPALEAMASGCPVVCSTAGSLPEVVGAAALTAPPADEEALAGHVARVLSDGALAQELSAAGRERSRRFRLDDMARGLAEEYRAAAGW